MTAIIFGASGGIGRALTEQIVQAEAHEQVYAVSRSGLELPGCVSIVADVTDEASLQALAGDLKAGGVVPELVIVASGVLSDGRAIQPEKSFRHQSFEAFQAVFAANTFGPALVAKHMLPLMPRDRRAVFAALSARVGSISDNRLGGWHAYRASKAALNMLIRNYAIEQTRRAPQFICVGLHPGTVDTGLSRPFQSNVPAGRLFTPDVSARHLLNVLAELTPDDTGQVFDWAGKAIPA